MRKATLLVGIAMGGLTPAAYAADWSARTEFRQSAEIDDNRALLAHPKGETYGFVSQLILNAVARYPALSVSLDADLSYRALVGAGADDNADPMDNGIRAKIEKFDRLSRYHFTGSWRRQDATSAQIADTGLTFVKGDINTYAVEGGIDRRVSALDTLFWSARGVSTDFDSPTASSFIDTSTTIGWRRRLTPTTDVFSSLQLQAIFRDDVYNSETVIARASSGLETRLSKQLTVKGSTGVAGYDTSRNASPTNNDTQSIGWLADLQLTYYPLNGTQVAFSASHDIAPNSIGETQERSSVGLTLQTTINRSSSLTLATSASRQTLLYASANLVGVNLDYGTADVFRGSLTYSYRLTQDWHTQLSYRFVQRMDDLGSANSNSLYLAFVREMTILP